MPRVGGSSWSLVVPDDWTVQYDAECLTLVAPSEAEALQVSAYRKDGPVVDDDLRGLSADHLAAGVVPVGACHGDFEGLAFTFPTEDGLARQEWYLRHGPMCCSCRSPARTRARPMTDGCCSGSSARSRPPACQRRLGSPASVSRRLDGHPRTITANQ